MIHTAAALAAALLVAPAAAQDRAPTTVAKAVGHADLDLRDARDVATFDRRIWRTARDLCGTASTIDMVGRRKDRQCTEAAVARVADARAKVIGTSQDVMVAGR